MQHHRDFCMMMRIRPHNHDSIMILTPADSQKQTNKDVLFVCGKKNKKIKNKIKNKKWLISKSEIINN